MSRINIFMKRFKQFLIEMEAPPNTPPEVFNVLYPPGVDDFYEPNPGDVRHEHQPWMPPGPRPDRNDPKYQGKEGQKQFAKDFEEWQKRQRMYDSYRELCPGNGSCKGIMTHPKPFTSPPPPGVVYYIGPDGRVYEWTESDESGTWEWILIKPGINVFNAPPEQRPLYNPPLQP
jgi:hypothetical protein